MLKALPPIDIDKMREPRFSHGETLRIDGLTADTLLTWHKRGVLVSISEHQPPGRGNRRRYSVLDLIYLAVLKEFAGKIPLAAAGHIAVEAIRPVLATYDMIRFTESAEDMNRIPSMAIIAYDDEAGQTQFNIFVDQAASGEMASPPGGMQGWMRSMNIRAAVIVDVATLTLELFAKIGDVMREQERREQEKKPARK